MIRRWGDSLVLILANAERTLEGRGKSLRFSPLVQTRGRQNGGDICRLYPTRVDFRFHEPEALADFCKSEIARASYRIGLTFVGRFVFGEAESKQLES